MPNAALQNTSLQTLPLQKKFGVRFPIRVALIVARSVVATLALSLLCATSTQTAVANGDTRTIYLFHAHTKEQIAATYRVNGQYDPAVLKQLNWFLRDWRLDEPTNMDPRLFDVVWETYRASGGANREVVVVSAYRSPRTNAMLRRRSRAVAEHSQHMLGKAMDTTMPGMSMAQVREIGMKLQRGGVGYYPSAGTPFVHLDVGSVRSWPRMGYDQLVRLFPDGKTVHLPSNGQPLARYEEARAEIAANGGVYVPPAQNSKGFFAFLFGGGGDDDDGGVAAAPPPARSQRGKRTQVADARQMRGQTQLAAYAEPNAGDDGGRNFALNDPARDSQSPAATPPIARAASAPPVAPSAPPPEADRQQIAALEQPPVKQPKPEPLPDPNEEAEPVADSAPTPPRRPSDLPAFAASSFVDSPLPPARPAALASINPRALSAAVSAYAPEPLLRRDPIGALIGDGKGVKPGALRAALFAPGAVGNLRSAAAAKSTVAEKTSGARSDVVSARLDSSNFRTMTSAQSAMRMTTQSVQGAAITAARSAARGNAKADSHILASATNAPPSRFGAKPSALSTSSFTPPAPQKRASGQTAQKAN